MVFLGWIPTKFFERVTHHLVIIFSHVPLIYSRNMFNTHTHTYIYIYIYILYCFKLYRQNIVAQNLVQQNIFFHLAINITYNEQDEENGVIIFGGLDKLHFEEHTFGSVTQEVKSLNFTNHVIPLFLIVKT